MAPRRKNRTRKASRAPWAGWAMRKPSQAQRRRQLKNCKPRGKCFLGPGTSFPVCPGGTCKVSKQGAWAAFIRARQWGGPKKAYTARAHPRHRRGVYRKVANKAMKIIHSRTKKRR